MLALIVVGYYDHNSGRFQGGGGAGIEGMSEYGVDGVGSGLGADYGVPSSSDGAGGPEENPLCLL